MKKEKEKKPVDDVITVTASYISEAKYARMTRMAQNQLNFECYHLQQNYSHKQAGQSKEFLAKQRMAVEQIVTFIQQGLIDMGDWFTMEKNAGITNPLITADEARQLVKRVLDLCDSLSLIGDSVKLGLLQSLMIAKPHGKFTDKAFFFTENKPKKEDPNKVGTVLKRGTRRVWVPKVDLLRAEDFYPDPTNEGLYFIQELFMDLATLKKIAKDPASEYDQAAIAELSGGLTETDVQAAKKANETAQNTTYTSYRRRVKIWECWGTLIDSQTGDVIFENATWTIADGRVVIKRPRDNPFWHGKIPFITSPFIRVPHSVWHTALMDAPTMTNRALNELYNLMVDDGMNSVHGVKQIRPDWLIDESQITNGIFPGLSVKVNALCPPNGKAIEQVVTGTMSAETMQVFNMMNAEFSSSSLTNDLRMGVMPNRAVKATEVVEASQSITSVFTGITKVIEENYVCPLIDMSWKNALQHLDVFDIKELKDMWGEDRANQILAIPKEQLFAELCDGFTFKVYGISRILSKMKDFKKMTALLQTLSADPVLMEEFSKEYSMSKFLAEIMRALDIPVDRIKLTDAEKKAMGAQQSALPPTGGAPAGSNAQSQIPQAGAKESAQTTESMVPRSDFGSLEGKANGGIA